MMLELVLASVLLVQCQSTLTPPLDRGVIVKVSENLIRDIAQVISERAVVEIKDLMLADEITESGVKFEYWHLRFTELTMTSSVDLSLEPGGDKLFLDGTVRGDLNAASRWRATKNTWFYNFVFDGSVTVRASGYRITARVVLGENDDGVVGFKHDPTACSVDLGGLDLNFSGSKASWLINLFIGFFEDEIREVMEHYICVEINEKVREGAEELEAEVFDRYDFVEVLGHRIEVNNRPTKVTGGETCAVVAGLGETDLEMEERETIQTEPFLPPTLPPLDFDEKETTDPTPPSSSSTTTSVIHVETIGPSKTPEMGRMRREVEDWCEVLPGAEGDVVVIITEEVISRFAEDLHNLSLIDYVATQETGKSAQYVVQWGGRTVGTMYIPTSEHDVLKNFQVTFRVTSTMPPTVNIFSEGVEVFSSLRARVTLIGEDSKEFRVEIHAGLTFTGTIELVHSNGTYSLVPTVYGSSEITKARFAIGRSLSMKVPEFMIEEVERQLDEMLGGALPEFVRDELKKGYPLNIPDSLVINDATILYRDDYILISADNVKINL